MEKREHFYTAGLWMVKPGKETDFVAAREEVVKWVVEKLGAMEAHLLQDLEQPQRFFSFGPWKDLQSIKAWRERPEFAGFLSKMKELCVDIQPHTMKSVADITSRSNH